MKPSIHVFSAQTIAQVAAEPVPGPFTSAPFVVISIATPGDWPPPKVPDGDLCLGVLRLVFDDADQQIPVWGGAASGWVSTSLFSPDQARHVWSFVTSHPEAQAILIHCGAGRSRSPGVAAALSKVLLGHDQAWFDRYTPNRLVYRRLLEEAETMGLLGR